MFNYPYAENKHKFSIMLVLIFMKVKNTLILLTILRSLSSPYRTGCSRLLSTSAPGLRQFSQRQPC